MTLWSLRILAGEIVRHPRQAAGILKRFRRTYRAANMLRDWTKIMRFGSGKQVCNKMSVYVPHWPSRALETRLRRTLRRDFIPPEQVTLAITDKCPYNCRHCSNVRGQAKVLSPERLKDLIKEIQDIGGSWLNIGCGEPSVKHRLRLRVWPRS